MKTKPPLVPWAVGHVGLVQKPVTSGLYLRRIRTRVLCGDVSERIICETCECKPKRPGPACQHKTCCVCGVVASDGQLVGWSGWPDFNPGSTIFCPRPECKDWLARQSAFSRPDTKRAQQHPAR